MRVVKVDGKRSRRKEKDKEDKHHCKDKNEKSSKNSRISSDAVVVGYEWNLCVLIANAR